MKHIFILLLALTGLGAYAQTESPEQALAKMEDQRLKAIINKDSVALSALYDDKYTGVLTSGRAVNKAGVMKFQMTNNPLVQITIEDVKANIYNNVGITTGRQVNRSKSGTTLGQSKFVRVYLKTGNSWKIVHSQGTLITEEQM